MQHAQTMVVSARRSAKYNPAASRFLMNPRQTSAPRQNARPDKSCSIQPTQRLVCASSAALPCRTAEVGRISSFTACADPDDAHNRKVRFAQLGALRDDAGLAPIASASNCTHKVATPVRAVKARSLSMSFANGIAQTPQAASVLHCPGKATFCAYLAENDPAISLPALAPSAQSCRGPDALAQSNKHGSSTNMAAKAVGARPAPHLLHGEARTEWSAGTSSMSRQPAHAVNGQCGAQQQQQRWQVHRNGLPPGIGQAMTAGGESPDLSALGCSLEAIRQRYAGSGCGTIAEGRQWSLPTASIFSIPSDGEAYRRSASSLTC